MTDKELLILVAEAVGIYGVINVTDEGLIVGESIMDCYVWNSLTRKADAFDLMVALEIEVRNFNGKSHAGKHNQFWCTETWFPDGDPLVATCRAITRAAAEIGRSMK